MKALTVLVMLLLLAGCGAKQTIRHLPSQQWKSETTQTIRMRYLDFQYLVQARGHEVAISAEAYPVVTALPEWASWYGEILLTLYVADSYGNVLAAAPLTLTPRPLKREGALPLSVQLDLGTKRDQPLFISFGYRLALCDASSTNAASGGKRVLVSEMALEE